MSRVLAGEVTREGNERQEAPRRSAEWIWVPIDRASVGWEDFGVEVGMLLGAGDDLTASRGERYGACYTRLCKP